MAKMELVGINSYMERRNLEIEKEEESKKLFPQLPENLFNPDFQDSRDLMKVISRYF